MPMRLTENEIEVINEVAEDLEIRVMTDYSGRGMFGRQCLALIIDDNPIDPMINFFLGLAELDSDLLARVREHATSMDDMGLGTVVYWPNISVSE